MGQQVCICVFAKPPEPGTVKTRLGPAVGNKGSATLAEAFLKDVWSAVQSLPWARTVIASTAPLSPLVVGGSPEVWLQGQGDLGARVERILRRALSQSEFAMALGADNPGLPPRLLEQARDAMRSADSVIGPCEDGGFYLLGLRQCPPGLLDGITWSHTDTFEQVLARLRAAGFRVSVLDSWFDVDRPEDLAKLRQKISSREIQAPATEKALELLFSRTPSTDTAGVSVILPVLNEREWLPRAIARLQSQPWVHEVIVVDASSTDGTRAWLQEQNQLIVLDAPRGKGIQINTGAKMATGNILLFLHADCLLPSDAGGQIRNALGPEDVAGGCFLIRFDSGCKLSLKLIAAGINLRTTSARTATGDQAIFVRKEVFDCAGGCPNWPLFEDVELVRRIKKHGSFAVIKSAVTSSSRRYLRFGIFKTTFLMYALRLGFWVGVSPFTLKTWFDDVRSDLTLHNSR